MSKMQELANLFDAWKSEFEIPSTDVYSDGIINETLFDSCKTGQKILVVAKEPNATNHDQNGDRSFVTEWDNQKAEYPFACRIAEWVSGIFQDFLPYDRIHKEARQYLRHISFMNVKKMGGGGSADGHLIHDIVSRHQKYIAKEIEIIGPDIVILGLSFDSSLIERIFGKLDWTPSGYAIDIARFGKSKIINFYHPSARNAPSASYSLLQNVVRSDKFIRL